MEPMFFIEIRPGHAVSVHHGHDAPQFAAAVHGEFVGHHHGFRNVVADVSRGDERVDMRAVQCLADVVASEYGPRRMRMMRTKGTSLVEARISSSNLVAAPKKKGPSIS